MIIFGADFILPLEYINLSTVVLMKKFTSIILLITLLSALIVSCGDIGSEDYGENRGDKDYGDKPSVVCCAFAEYDFARNIAGEAADITLLVNSGEDIHNYTPGAADILKISGADLFIYIGGESEYWVEDVTASAKSKGLRRLALIDSVNTLTEEELEGMDDSGHEGEHHGDEADEHIWLSLRNAEKMCAAIRDALSELNPDCSGIYASNFEKYTLELRALDEKYKSAMDRAENKVIVFTDRFPFRYLCSDYSLEPYAAFSGCSAESEASAKTVAFLIDKVKEYSLRHVIVIDGSDRKLAETVSGDTGTDILTLNSLQNISEDDIKNNVTYLSIMEANLDILTEALKR